MSNPDPLPPHDDATEAATPAGAGKVGCLRQLFRLALVAAILLGLAAILILRTLSAWLDPIPLGDTPLAVKIFEGDSVRKVTARLQESGIVRRGEFPGLLLRGLLRLRRIDSALKPGEYRFSGEISLLDVVDRLERGAAEPVYRLTLPEGLTAAETASRLAASNLRDRTNAVELVRALDPARSGLSLGTVEGLLFPETYHYGPRTSVAQILDLMLKGFREALPPDYEVALLELDLTLAEAVALASIVEREARLKEERPVIARVFLNRLAKGMRLESCATVMYALGGWRERLLLSDTRVPSPYNTYQVAGLPPTPICSPGRLSLEAVFTAPPNDLYYFVARGDGGHIFSRTYKEHLDAIRRVKADAAAKKKDGTGR